MGKGIFEGLKVLDCASFIAAPAAATVLSDFGADVIKIEPPGAGDPYRNLPNLPGYPASEHNFAWLLDNRNKRGLALDLAKPEGQAVLHKLAEQADVFITNYPPQVRAKLGITYDHLAPTQRTADLRLLHRLWREGRGSQQARLRQQRLLGALRPDGSRARRQPTPPRRVRSPAWAIIPAPWRFMARSSPRCISASAPARARMSASNLMANGVWAASVLAQAKLSGAKFGERRPRERALNAVTNHYRCKDDRWLILSLLNEERQWPTLARMPRTRGPGRRSALCHQGRTVTRARSN